MMSYTLYTLYIIDICNNAYFTCFRIPSQGSRKKQYRVVLAWVDKKMVPLCIQYDIWISPIFAIKVCHPLEKKPVSVVMSLLLVYVRAFSSESPHDSMHDMLSGWFIVLGELDPNHVWFPLTISLFDNPVLIHSSIISHLLAHYEKVHCEAGALYERVAGKSQMPHGIFSFEF